MDALKAEIASKRKAMPTLDARPSKYMRRGDIERLREEAERKEREEKEAKLKAEKEKAQEKEKAERKERAGNSVRALVFTNQHRTDSSRQSIDNSRSATRSPHPESTTDAAPSDPSLSFNIPDEEAVRRLRAKGQPIRLFGESDRDRGLRIRALELIEEKDNERIGGQNDFRKALEDVESRQKDVDPKTRKRDGREGKDGVGEVLDLDLVKTDPDKLYPIIYYALKGTLKEWEAFMDDRPGG